MDPDGLESLLDAFPTVSYAFAYGSGVYRQRGYTEEQARSAMTDVVFAVEDPEAWHRENLERHREHYSGLAWFGPQAVATVQDRGAGLYYNPYASVDGRLIKYGVISRMALEDDLRHWSALYVSGRMHKPVRVLADRTEGVASLANANRRSALTAALLMLPQEFSEHALYTEICALSYAGDVRGGVAEAPGKVGAIVAAQLPLLRDLYAAPLARSRVESCAVPSAAPAAEAVAAASPLELLRARQQGGGAATSDGAAASPAVGSEAAAEAARVTLHQPGGLEARQDLMHALPSTAKVELLDQLHYQLRHAPPAASDRRDPAARDAALCDAAERLWHRQPTEAAGAAALALSVRRSLARIVLRASAVQSVKGLLTAGGARALQYLGEKIAKRLK